MTRHVRFASRKTRRNFHFWQLKKREKVFFINKRSYLLPPTVWIAGTTADSKKGRGYEVTWLMTTVREHHETSLAYLLSAKSWRSFWPPVLLTTNGLSSSNGTPSLGRPGSRRRRLCVFDPVRRRFRNWTMVVFVSPAAWTVRQTKCKVITLGRAQICTDPVETPTRRARRPKSIWFRFRVRWFSPHSKTSLVNSYYALYRLQTIV